MKLILPTVASFYAMTQTLWASVIQTVPGFADTHALLGIVSVVNSVLSIGVVLGAISLAYGYGKLNARVEALEKEADRWRDDE